jgi:excisionase family DNA binding protein
MGVFPAEWDDGAPARMDTGFKGLTPGVDVKNMESREVMNLRQASHYLGVSPDTLYRYVSEGQIPAFKLGNRWKFKKTILDRWMETKMSQARVPKRRKAGGNAS